MSDGIRRDGISECWRGAVVMTSVMTSLMTSVMTSLMPSDGISRDGISECWQGGTHPAGPRTRPGLAPSAARAAPAMADGDGGRRRGAGV